LTNGITYLETQFLYEKGMDLESMAQTRNMSPITIASHLIKLKEAGDFIDLQKFITKAGEEKFEKAAKKIGLKLEPEMRIQPLLDEFGESVPSWELRLIYYCRFQSLANG
jgi:ATP-dependent DNA helicase RecQ